MKLPSKLFVSAAIAAFVAASPMIVLADDHKKGPSEKGMEMMDDKAKEMMDKRDEHKETMEKKKEAVKEKAKKSKKDK